jgi:hypothetical protein
LGTFSSLCSLIGGLYLYSARAHQSLYHMDLITTSTDARKAKMCTLGIATKWLIQYIDVTNLVRESFVDQASDLWVTVPSASLNFNRFERFNFTIAAAGCAWTLDGINEFHAYSIVIKDER